MTTFQKAVVFTLMFSVSGCSSEATILRPSATPLSGKIMSSDAEHLLVKHGEVSSFALEREEVQSIDHPGNVVAVTGVCLLALGAMLAGSKDDRTEAQVNLAMVSAPGLAMAIWGALTYSRSKNAAHAFEDRTEKEKKKKDDEDRPFLPAPTWNFTQPPQATVRGPTVRQ